MAKRFYSDFTSIHNIDYIVEVWDSSFAGTAQPFSLGAGGFSLSYAGDNNERFATIFASQVEFTFYVENGFHASFEFALITNTEGRFSVKIFREGSLYWVGQILPDIVEILDQPTVNGRPMVIKATDGLGRLKDIDYNDNGTAYTGTETVIEHLFNILSKLNILSLMSTDCVKTSLGWREDSMTTGDQYALTRIGHKAFIKVDDKGTLNYSTCADVLKQLLLAWNARIIQVDGCFYVIQVGQYVTNSMTVYSYDSAGTGTGSATSQTFQQTDDAFTGDMIRLSGGRFSYLPPLLFTKVNYKHFSSQNISVDRALTISTTYPVITITNNDVGSGLIVSFDLQNKITFSDPSQFNYLYVKFNLEIKVGSFYYRRDASISDSGVITYSQAYWTNEAAFFQIFTTPIVNDQSFFSTKVEFVTDDILDNGDLTVRFTFDNYYTLTGSVFSSGAVSLTSYVNEFYIELIELGVIQNRVQTTTYEAKNANTDVSVGKDIDLIIGDGVLPFTFGKLQVYDGLGWVDSNAWTGLGESTPSPILQLLANEIMAGQAKPVQKLESTWEATGYKANMSILYNSENYLPLQCRLDANRDDWSGEFFAVTRTLADADPQTPVKRLPSPGDIIRRVDINREIPPATPIVEPVVRQLGVVYVRNETPYFTSGDLVGNIPIVATAYENTFLDGDPVYLVNNLTGQIQRFEVSGDVPIGATYLNVVPESADFDIIPGAVVIPDYGFQANRINTAGAVLYQQDYDNHGSNVLTWTENGGVLPTTNTKATIQVYMNGQKLRETLNYTISGSDITIDSNLHYNGSYYEVITYF